MGGFIIEFNGIPGAGKSTLSNLIIESLRNKGFIVLSDKELLKKKNKIIKLKELFLYCFRIKQLAMNYRIMKFTINLSFQIHHFKPILKAIKIIRYNGLLLEAKKSYDFIVMSEGNKQFIEATLDDIEYEKENLLERIIKDSNDLLGSSLLVTCRINKIDAISRVINRGFYPNSKIDSPQKLETLMDNRVKNMEVLNDIYKQYSNFLEIDTNNNAQDNAEFILSLIKIRKK